MLIRTNFQYPCRVPRPAHPNVYAGWEETGTPNDYTNSTKKCKATVLTKKKKNDTERRTEKERKAQISGCDGKIKAECDMTSGVRLGLRGSLLNSVCMMRTEHCCFIWFTLNRIWNRQPQHQWARGAGLVFWYFNDHFLFSWGLQDIGNAWKCSNPVYWTEFFNKQNS